MKTGDDKYLLMVKEPRKYDCLKNKKLNKQYWINILDQYYTEKADDIGDIIMDYVHLEKLKLKKELTELTASLYLFDVEKRDEHLKDLIELGIRFKKETVTEITKASISRARQYDNQYRTKRGDILRDKENMKREKRSLEGEFDFIQRKAGYALDLWNTSVSEWIAIIKNHNTIVTEEKKSMDKMNRHGSNR